MKTKILIDLDIERDEMQGLYEALVKCNLKHEIIGYSYPPGGGPILVLEGEHENIKQFYDEYYKDEPEDYDRYLDMGLAGYCGLELGMRYAQGDIVGGATV